ncbi:hypothetical protein BaRGS_00013848 [Batillaria attramentaria]|uniref:C-type lectin domain-containing protein n=1 Tax=Batillaria attramentaria TaxID=370345 RepID=A0ABD0L5U4_9CAEN
MATEDKFTVRLIVVVLLSCAGCLTFDTNRNQSNEGGQLTHPQLLSVKSNDKETLPTNSEKSVGDIGATGNRSSTENNLKTERMSITSGSHRTTRSSVVNDRDDTQTDKTPTGKPLISTSKSQDGHVIELRDVGVRLDLTTGAAALKNTDLRESKAVAFANRVLETNPPDVSTTERLGAASKRTSLTAVHQEAHQTRSSTKDPGTEETPSVSQQATSRETDIPETHTYLRNLTLLSLNISACFRQEKPLELYAYEGFVHYNKDDFDNYQDSTNFFAVANCIIVVHVPDGLTVQSFDIKLRASHGSLRFEDMSTGNTLASVAAFDSFKEYPHVFSFSESMRVTIMSMNPDLWCYVQTPGYDGRTKYPDNVDSWARVDIPANHSIMISFPVFDVEFPSEYGMPPDSMEMYLGGKSTDDIIFNSEPVTPTPALYGRSAPRMNGTTLHVHFHSGSTNVRHAIGFKMLFSFHNNTALPEQLSNGTWNCSVPYWDDFRDHFVCNFKLDCFNGEDERGCLYKNHTCGEGWVLLRGKCYVYVTHEQSLSWYDASDACKERGGYLASLNTPNEYLAVMHFLMARADSDVFVGFQYQVMPQLADKTIAYYAFMSSVNRPRPFCGYFARRSRVLETLIVECGSRHTGHYLCELETTAVNTVNITTRRDKEELGIVISTPTLWISSSTVPYAECPAGHVTHDFLACDVQSACWSRDDLSASCSAPLFTCANTYERVHYTFVCDYRPDCSDASDENFCVIPPCQPATEFSCGNKQCLPKWVQCDNAVQCANGEDEKRCSNIYYITVTHIMPPASHADLEKLTNLRVLSLAGNPLTQVTMTQLHEAQTIPWLLSLDLSRIPFLELNVHLVYMFPNLETLNMSGNGVDRMQGEGFHPELAELICTFQASTTRISSAGDKFHCRNSKIRVEVMDYFTTILTSHFHQPCVDVLAAVVMLCVCTVVWVVVVLVLTYHLVCWALSRLRVGDYSKKHVLITGCDTGFGNLLAKRLDELGFNVFASCLTSAGSEKLQLTCSQRVTTLQLDVTDENSISAAQESVQSKLPAGKGLWGVVNNAGIGCVPVMAEWMTRDDYVKCLSVNIFGMIDVTRVFLPLVRKERGRVVNMSSISGRFAYTPAPYHVSKYGVEAFSDCLRREVYRQGVKVCIVEPGGFKTDILNKDRLVRQFKQRYDATPHEMKAPYSGKTPENFTRAMDRILSAASDKPHMVVDACELALTSRFPPTRQLVTSIDVFLFYSVMWVLPTPLVDWILDKLL